MHTKALCTLLAMLIGASTSPACTIFNASVGDSVMLAGNNEDWFNHVGKITVYAPTETRFGMIYWGVEFEERMGGVNDRGLFYDWNSVFYDVELEIDPDKPYLPANFEYQLLSTCATVDEALDYLNDYNLTFYGTAQMHIADATGASAIVEGDSVIVKDGYYQISTNFYQSFEPDPCGDHPDIYWRYCTADSMLAENEGNITVDLMRDVCDATSQTVFNAIAPTVYSTVADLKNNMIYVYYFRDFERVVEIDMAEEFEQGSHSFNVYDRYIEAYPEANPYPGVWRSVGYGIMLGIDYHEGFQSYTALMRSVTNYSLLPMAYLHLDGNGLYVTEECEEYDLIASLDRVSHNELLLTRSDGWAIDGNPLAVLIADMFDLWQITGFTGDPVANFEAFWYTFREQSSLLNLTNTDWQEVYDTYRPQVSAGTTGEELFSILSTMVASLNDGQMTLTGIVGGETMEFTGGPEPQSAWLRDRENDLRETIVSYLDGQACHWIANDNMFYGTIGDSVGYLNILGFDGYTDGVNAAVENDIFAAALDTILYDFRNHDALIVDIRLSSGGWDNLPITLANRFATQELVAYSKAVRLESYMGFTSAVPHYVEPDGEQFLYKPIIILTSSCTARAGDLQAMILKHPLFTNVTQIGETTYGAFSEPLDKVMPNGWVFSLSNEKFTSHDGIWYEQTGIEPDIEEVQSENALNQGVDNVLERALLELANLHATDGVTLPRKYSLLGSQPNPFSHQTSIVYALPKACRVLVTVHNSSGQLVHTLMDTNQEAGVHRVTWDGTSKTGFPATSGAYFCRLEISGEDGSAVFDAQHRLILVR